MPVPGLTPFRPAYPAIAESIQYNKDNQFKQETRARGLEGMDEASKTRKIERMKQAFDGVTDQQGYDTAIRFLRSQSKPGDEQHFEEGMNRIFPNGYDQSMVDQITKSAKAYLKNIKPGIKDGEAGFYGYDEETNEMKKVGGDVEPYSTVSERKTATLLRNTPKLARLAAEDPNYFNNNHKYRLNDDGTLYTDPGTGTAVELRPIDKVLGKRGNIQHMRLIGESWDDAKELAILLRDPQVMADLKAAERDGVLTSANIWDSTKGALENKMNKWLQERGVVGKSNATASAIARIQKMASEERKKFLGTAVTAGELKTVLSWMPSAGDSFDQIVNKTNMMAYEGEQELRRFLEMFQDDAHMGPVYRAFKINRFGEQQGPAPGERGFDDPIRGDVNGIPAGSIQIGTLPSGEKVWKTLDGRELVEE